MNLTVRHLEYLISRHDCVIVPGLGAVLARNVSAEESADCGRWTPPCRNYSFNGSLTETDGLLAGSVARALGISHERATELLADELLGMRRQLDHEGSLSLGRVGRLYRESDEGVLFEPAEKDLLTPFATWYRPFELRPVDVAAAEVSDDESLSKGAKLTPFGRFMRIAAAIIVLVAVGLAVSTPVSVEDAQYASLTLPAVTSPKKAIVPAVARPAEVNAEAETSEVVAETETVAPKLELNNRIEIPVTVAEKSVKAKAVKPVASIRLNDFDEYCLVVASLVSEEAAGQFILDESRRNPGLAMGILEQNGRYRVYAATGKTQAQALSAASNPKISRYKGVWVTRRPHSGI